MTLRDLIASDAAAFFEMGDFEESVTYTPFGGEPLTFNAIVFREEPNADRPETPRARFHQAQVAIRNTTDNTKGVATVTPNKDRMTIVLREGDAATEVRVLRIISVDEGVWMLEVAA